MPAKRKINVRKINGELHVITDGNHAIPTGYKSKIEYLHALDLSCNYYAVETTLVDV